MSAHNVESGDRVNDSGRMYDLFEKFLEQHTLQARYQVETRKPEVAEKSVISKTQGAFRSIIPIVISALLSAISTGIVTVTSISRELAVEHASVSIALKDYDRRISNLEKVIVPRSELDTSNRSLQETLRSLQDQVKTTDTNVNDIRRVLYERFSSKR